MTPELELFIIEFVNINGNTVQSDVLTYDDTALTLGMLEWWGLEIIDVWVMKLTGTIDRDTFPNEFTEHAETTTLNP